MKPRSTEYDQWMKLLKAIQPPFHEGGCADESEWDKYYDCSFEMRFVRNDGTVVASAAHWTGADAFEASERYITDIMDIVRDEEGDEYDYSDPDDRGDPEIIYTGGNIYCGLRKLDEGWFFGDLNGWGEIFDTKEHAIACDESGVIRSITNLNEQIGIWMQFYDELSEDRMSDLSDGDIAEYISTLVIDLKSYL